MCKLEDLYIPHGSDETKSFMEIKQDLKNDFISHTVQMKLTKVDAETVKKIIFISHTVQMKQNIVKRKRIYISGFISHTVQMKLFLNFFQIIAVAPLYIPHGSDETEENKMLASYIAGFISHTVQMKLFPSPLNLLHLFLSLYPTRFR